MPGEVYNDPVYIFGWNDYSEYKKYDDGTYKKTNANKYTDGYCDYKKGKYDLWNGKVPSSKKNLQDAISWVNKPGNGDFNGEKAEAVNLLKLTKELSQPYVGVSYSWHDISMRQQIPNYNDANGDHYRNDWETYKYDPKGNIVLTNQDARQWKMEKMAYYVLPPQGLFKDTLQIDGGMTMSIIDYANDKGSDYQDLDSTFRFYPWEDVNTPAYLLALKGNQYDVSHFGSMVSESFYANLTLPMYSVIGDPNKADKGINWARVLCPIIISQPSIGYKLTHTTMGISLFTDYNYDEASKNLVSPETSSLFESWRHDFNLSASTRTIPLGKWPNTYYLSVSGGFQYSWLSKNMPDIFYPAAASRFPADYLTKDVYMDNVLLSKADKQAILDDYNNNYLPKIANDILTAGQGTLNINANTPGVVQTLREIGLIHEGVVDSGADENIKCNLQGVWTLDDYIRNTDAGMYPSVRNVWAEWTKSSTILGTDVDGNNIYPAATKYMTDTHDKIDPVNSFALNFSASYKMRLGHLCNMKSAWETVSKPDIHGGNKQINAYIDEMASDWRTTKPVDWAAKALWFVPSFVFYPVEKLVTYFDPGREKDSDLHLYMPLEFGISREWYAGQKEPGESLKFGIGLGINDDITLMYRSFISDNKQGYKDNTQQVALTVLFGGDTKSRTAHNQVSYNDEKVEEKKEVVVDQTGDKQKQTEPKKKDKATQDAIKKATNDINKDFRDKSKDFQAKNKIDPSSDYGDVLKTKIDRYLNLVQNQTNSENVQKQLQTEKDYINKTFDSEFKAFVVKPKDNQSSTSNTQKSQNPDEKQQQYNAAVIKYTDNITKMFVERMGEYKKTHNLDPKMETEYNAVLQSWEDQYTKSLSSIDKDSSNFPTIESGAKTDASDRNFDAKFKKYVLKDDTKKNISKPTNTPQTNAGKSAPIDPVKYRNQKYSDLQSKFDQIKQSYIASLTSVDDKQQFMTSDYLKEVADKIKQFKIDLTKATLPKDVDKIMNNFDTYCKSSLTQAVLDKKVGIRR